jgi:hypothetical protein
MFMDACQPECLSAGCTVMEKDNKKTKAIIPLFNEAYQLGDNPD